MKLTVAERQAALEQRFPRWPVRTLHEALDAAAQEFPDRPFVITGDRRWTYAEMQDWSQRLARGLADSGVRPGEHVAVVMANYPEFVALKFAISRVGAVSVPVNFLNRRDELGYVLLQSDAVMLVTMDRFRSLDYLQALDELAPGWESLGGGDRFPLLRRVVVFPTGQSVRPGAATLAQLDCDSAGWSGPAAIDAQAPSDIIYTSGTTGPPKGVLLSHDMLLRTAYGSAYGRAFEDGHRIVFALPMYHVYGYVEGLLSVLFVGGAIVPQLQFDPAATVHEIERHEATDVLLIPTMTVAVIDFLKQERHALPSLRSVISSGGKSPVHLWDEIFEWLHPDELVTGYGMTECTASTTVTRPDDPRERLRTTNGRLRDVGVAGEPTLGGKLVVYRVVDPDSGLPVGTGEVGELRARGPGVTRGYYNKPEATAAAFDAEGWLHTGDLGRLDADGYVTLVGRLKECYRCGGEQVVPSDIEDLLLTHPSVAQAHVVPVPDARMGEVGAAFIVPRPGAIVEADALIAFCAARLARFKVPKYVLAITADDLPTTPSGRARKFLLTRKAIEALAIE